MHPVFEEIARWNDLPRHDVFRRVQRTIRDEVGPRMDALEAAETTHAATLEENAALKVRIAELEARKRKGAAE